MKTNGSEIKGLSEGLANLCRDWGQQEGLEAIDAKPLGGGGSGRRYWRITFARLDATNNGLKGGGLSEADKGRICSKQSTVIGCEGDNLTENRAFVSLSKLFAGLQMPAPGILAVAKGYSCYLQHDLGDKSLFSVLSSPDGWRLAKQSLRLLPHVQGIPEEEWDNLVFNPPFRGREILNDLHYFKYSLLKTIGIEFDEAALEREFDDIIGEIDAIDGRYRGLMLRDFQSRNVMVKDAGHGSGGVYPFLIDYQGARKGPVLYDAVSFLWQAKAGFSAEERREGLKVYAGAYTADSHKKEELLQSTPVIVLVRTLQVLGAYGLRGLTERKAHFLESLKGGIRNLQGLLANPEEQGSPVGWKVTAAERWPELSRISRSLVKWAGKKGLLDDKRGENVNAPRLTLHVFSFSYKKGYPEDLTGNGGGFMFDCRGLPNPGRYEEYKTLTGMDREVIAFLDSKTEVEEFLYHAWVLVRGSISLYQKRGFTSLQVGFGCTGGRHRSVYCSEHFARLAAQAFPELRVEVKHREQNCDYTLGEGGGRFKVMVPAAGLGTRLKPWTLQHPKALVPVAGKPAIERVFLNLMKQGAGNIGVNVHHFAGQVKEYLDTEESKGLLEKYGATVCVSDETAELLETGGGIVKMAGILDPEGEGFVVHNADILDNADLRGLLSTHGKLNPNGVTLLVSERASSRKLDFNQGGLAGWRNLKSGEVKEVTPRQYPVSDIDAEGMKFAKGEKAFSGIYAVSGAAVREMSRIYGNRAFPVMDYLLNPERRNPVLGVEQEELRILDIGKPETLAEAEAQPWIWEGFEP